MVTGGRSYTNRQYVFETLDTIHLDYGITLLIHGACGWDADDPRTTEKPLRGADGLADEWALERRVEVERVPAHWSTLRAAAGPARNRVLIARKPNLVVAFPGGAGTRNALGLARRAKLRVWEA